MRVRLEWSGVASRSETPRKSHGEEPPKHRRATARCQSSPPKQPTRGMRKYTPGGRRGSPCRVPPNSNPNRNLPRPTTATSGSSRRRPRWSSSLAPPLCETPCVLAGAVGWACPPWDRAWGVPRRWAAHAWPGRPAALAFGRRQRPALHRPRRPSSHAFVRFIRGARGPSGRPPVRRTHPGRRRGACGSAGRRPRRGRRLAVGRGPGPPRRRCRRGRARVGRRASRRRRCLRRRRLQARGRGRRAGAGAGGARRRGALASRRRRPAYQCKNPVLLFFGGATTPGSRPTACTSFHFVEATRSRNSGRNRHLPRHRFWIAGHQLLSGAELRAAICYHRPHYGPP
jgi:hypothetical protein